MRKHYLLMAGIIPALSAAQITVTSADLPHAGDEWGLFTDDDGGTAFAITPASSSPQTWNYASAFDNLSTYGFSWAAASTVIGSADFPNADLGIDYGGSASFYAAETDGLYNAGAYFPFGGFSETEHITGALILPVPFTYGNVRTYTSTSNNIIVFDNGDPAMKVVQRGSGTFTCDAFGTMMTPVYPSGTQVIRVVWTRDVTVDSTFMDMTGTGNGPWTFSSTEQNPGNQSHMFLRNGAPTLVADISAGGQSATYYSPALPEGIAEPASQVREIQAYPVPSTEGMVHIPVGGTDVHTLEVVNALGEQIKRIGVKGTDLVHLATGNFAQGTYLFKCLNANGAVIGQGRFIVAR